MNILTVGLDVQEISVRSLRIYVRVKGLMSGIMDGTSKTRAPATIFEFIKRITQEGKFIPQEYVLPIEKKRLTFDINGRLT